MSLPALLREQCYIDGQWVGADSGETIDVTNPATGAVLGQSNIGAGVSLSPVVANSTLYILDDNGRLHAYR